MTPEVSGKGGMPIQRRDRRTFVRPLWALALGLFLLASAITPERADARPSHQIYCIRGVFNVFSLGMDDICDKLRKMGLSASVHNHVVWASIADEAAANYKSGKARSIILIGHSAGASAVADIAARLGELGVPVKLAIELDCLWGTTASGHVEQFLNYYVADGAGKLAVKGPKFRGTLRNISLSKKYPDIGHLNIDKNSQVHSMVITHVRQALATQPASPAPPSTPSPPAAGTTGASAGKAATQ